MKRFVGGYLLALFLTGCETAHKPGPVIALYQKAGGPDYKRGQGQYDSAVIGAFFKSHQQIREQFIGQGKVCSLTREPLIDEATQDRLICDLAAYSYVVKASQ